MKWTVEGDHRRHYEEYGFVGLYGVATPEQCEAMLETELEGHDLWRQNKTFAEITTSRKLAGLIAELTRVERIRLAYDQTPQVGPLDDRTSVQWLIGGLLVRLSPDGEAEEPLPAEQGSALFISPTYDLSLDGGKYLLIAYTSDPSIYIHNSQDPYTGVWKRLGLTYGDRLTSPLFPLLAK